MSTLSKSCPEFTISDDAYKSIGNILSDIGGRVLLICSMNPNDREFISLIKAHLKERDITFIQSDQSVNFTGIDDLDKLVQRADVFKVSTILSAGDICQRMSGRFLAYKLGLNYVEIPFTVELSYLLIPKAIYSDRVKHNYISSNFDKNKLKHIVVDTNMLRNYQKIDILVESLTLLLNLTTLFTNKENNLIARNESLNLFNRVLNDLKADTMNSLKLLEYSLASTIYHGASSDIDYELFLYSITAGYRYTFNPYIACAKLLPYYLDKHGEDEYAKDIRGLMNSNNITSRLSDLGFTLEQLIEICNNNSSTISLIEKAY